MILLYDMFSTRSDLEQNRKIIAVYEKSLISCTQEKALNGKYAVDFTLVAGVDDDSKLKPKEYFRAPDGQLYIIYRVERDVSLNFPKVTVRGEHIWYYLSRRIVYESETQNFNALYAISMILNDPKPEPVKFTFDFQTNLGDQAYQVNWYGQTKAQALLGASDSVVNLYGGELYRDNFYFSIDKKLQNSKENAFLIAEGWNMTGIKEVVDDSDNYTSITGEDNYGQMFAISWIAGRDFPYQVDRFKKFSYSSADISYLSKDVTDYFDQHSTPNVSYSVTLSKVKDPVFQQFQEFDVGDSGVIYSYTLGTFVTQRVIERKKDLIKEEVTSVKLGNVLPSTLYGNRFSSTIATSDSSGRRLDAVENELRRMNE